jgi:hypothetical protein
MMLTIIIFTLIGGMSFGADSVTPGFNSFSGGVVTPHLEGRTDYPRYSQSLRQGENMVIHPAGYIEKRPGTTMGKRWPDIFSTASAYPTLHILDPSEIPAKPATPTVTTTSPIVLTTRAGVAGITGSNHYVLGGDINLNLTWTPIAGFSGVLDGAGYTLSNHYVTSGTGIGLFADLQPGAKIKDLTIETAQVIGTNDSGVIAGTAPGGDITLLNINIVNSSATTGGSTGVRGGGLIGHVTIADGGVRIAGCNVTDTTVSSGAATAAEYGGGFFGLVDGANAGATDCYIIDSSVNNLTISGEDMFGGFIGKLDMTNATDNFMIHSSDANDINITVYDHSETAGKGGFIGDAWQVDMVSCTAKDVSVVGGSNLLYMHFVGGLAGRLWNKTQIVDCDVVDLDIVCSTTGSAGDLVRAGGFVGLYRTDTLGGDMTMRGCSATGTIRQTHSNNRSFYRVAGAIGLLNWFTDSLAPSTITFDRVWTGVNLSLVVGYNTDACGGFIGEAIHNNGELNQTAIFQDCYAWGTIIADNGVVDPVQTQGVGGFAGYIRDNGSGAGTTWTFDNCYAAQTADASGSTSITNGITDDGNGNIGGFIGAVGTPGIFSTTNCFFDYETCGFQTTALTASDKTTTQMMAKATFTDAGWAFSATEVKDTIADIWKMPSGVTTPGSPDSARLIPFIFSTDDSVVLSFQDSLAYFLVTEDGVSGAVQQ